MLERSLGRGSVVLATDSFFASNEGLFSDRRPELLAWVLGGARRVVFDETHLGVAEPGGVAALARRYRLGGLIGGLILLAALYVWRTAVPFAPSAASRSPREGEGREAWAGLAALLRRGLPERRLLVSCVEAWRRSFGLRLPPEVVAEVERLAAESTEPVTGYAAIQHSLALRGARIHGAPGTEDARRQGERGRHARG